VPLLGYGVLNNSWEENNGDKEMKKNFDKSLEMLLHHEGGYVNHPKDPGGETNLGVTRAVYEQWVGRQVMDGEMKSLTVDDVAPIYKKNYWDRVRGDDLPSGLDWAAMDWAVNSGVGRPAKVIQRFVSAKQDGAIGPQTLRLIAENDPGDIIQYLYEQRQKFYERLKTFETFGRGWTRRNQETLKAALEMANEA
jgi:lysozyme family protein